MLWVLEVDLTFVGMLSSGCVSNVPETRICSAIIQLLVECWKFKIESLWIRAFCCSDFYQSNNYKL